MKFKLIVAICLLAVTNVASASETMPCYKGDSSNVVTDIQEFADNCFKKHAYRESEANGEFEFDVDLDGVMDRFETREHFQYVFKKTDDGYKYLGLIGMAAGLFAILRSEARSKPVIYVAKKRGWNEENKNVIGWYVQTYEYQDDHFKQTDEIVVTGTDKLFGSLFPHLAQ